MPYPTTPGPVRFMTKRPKLLLQADGAIDRARSLIQAGDVRGAVSALNEARTIDSVGAWVAEVSQLMADRFKSQAEAAELELKRSRVPAPVQSNAASRPPLTPSTAAKPTPSRAVGAGAGASPAAAKPADDPEPAPKVETFSPPPASPVKPNAPPPDRKPSGRQCRARLMTMPQSARWWRHTGAQSSRRTSRCFVQSSRTLVPTRSDGSSRGFVPSPRRR